MNAPRGVKKDPLGVCGKNTAIDKEIIKYYKSFDKKLSEQEQIYLEEGLSASEELRKEKEDIALLRKTVSQTDHRSFGAGFVEGVMTEVIQL